MRRLLAASVFMLLLDCGPIVPRESASRVVLPNPKLLRCKSSDCFQMWVEKSVEASAVFPKQFSIDMNDQNCLYGMKAPYDKSISLDDIKAAIDERYGKWALPGFENSGMKLWRVEPEKFAIQLSVADKADEKRQLADAGTKQAIYIAFGGASACNVP